MILDFILELYSESALSATLMAHTFLLLTTINIEYTL